MKPITGLLKLKLTLLFLLLSVAKVYPQQVILNGIDAEPVKKKTESKKAEPKHIERDSKTFECGDIFTDPRDGQEYNTVEIGGQCWMSDNLDYGTMIPGDEDMLFNEIPEKYCYDDDPANCDAFGALYRWDEMMQYTTSEGVKGLCPDGWHLPTDTEWCILEQEVDPSIVCDATFWRGNDGGTLLKVGGNSGFEGQLAGYMFTTGTSLQMGQFGYFWTSSQWDDSRAVYRGLGNDFTTVKRYNYSKGYGLSVRCIKGDGTTNLAPAAPSNPSPQDGANNLDIGAVIEWECTDPESDPLLFDVYFGTDPNPPLAYNNLGGTTYNPGDLDYFTEYFWKIVAKDGQGNATEGPVWSFTTKSQGGIFQCGTAIVDPRDNQSYNTILIGDKCWMAENLNIGTRIDAGNPMTENGIIEKYCYENDPAICDVYGGLYQWDEMMQYASTQGAKGICMDGWRLPTDNEWKELEGIADSEFGVGDPEWDNWSWRGSDVGGNLKETGTSHWNSPNAGATNNTGFTAIGGGYASGSSFTNLGKFGMYWTSTPYSSDNAIMRGVYYALTTNMRNDYSKALAISVRCIQSNTSVNEPPATPSDPVPENGSLNQPVNSVLEWDCFDPDGDPLTYDIYFGDDPNPPLLAEGVTEKNYDPGTLENDGQFFWKIVAHDDHENTTEGPVWNFQTEPVYYNVTFYVEDQGGNALQNAVITLDGQTNDPGDYVFDEVPAGTSDYSVALENYITAYGQVIVTDQSVSLTVTLTMLVIIDEFPFTEGFDDGYLPEGWQNLKWSGDYSWEFATDPFPHAFIHNIGRTTVNARLVTPLLDVSNLGEVTLGLNQRFWMEPAGGIIQILVSTNGQDWTVVEEYTSSIGTGDNFEYTEYNLTEFAAGEQVFVALNANFPDTDASYEAVWEVENLTVFQPGYPVSFAVEDLSGNALVNATITLADITNQAGNYMFDNIPSGSYTYFSDCEGFTRTYGFISIDGAQVNDTIRMATDTLIAAFPFSENFNGNVLPDGWQNVPLGDPEGMWSFAAGKAEIESVWGDHTRSRLVSPPMDCSDLEAVALGIAHEYIDIMEVGYAEIQISTDGNNWAAIDHFQGENKNNFPYTEYYITGIAAGQPEVYLGFLYDDMDETEFWWKIDSVSVFEPLPYDLIINPLDGNQYGDEGSTVSFDFELTNSGINNDTYALEILNAAWPADLSQSFISIDAGQKDTVTATVHIPGNLNMGDLNKLTLQVTSQGDNSIVKESEFTAIAVSTIKDDYHENFDLVEAPVLPGGWSKVQNSTSSWSRVETEQSNSIAPVSPPNNIKINVANDLNAELILISPEIDVNPGLSAFRVLFKLRNGQNAPLLLGTMDAPGGTFTPLQTCTTTEHFTWEYFMYSFEAYQGTDRYIAFRLDVIQTNSAAYLDDITFQIIPPPILNIDPSAWDFGDYWVEYPSEVPLEIDLRNIGHDFLTVNNIYLDNTDDFILDYDHTLLNTNLYWNDNIPLTVSFKASSPGPKSGNIQIEFTDTTSHTRSIPLQGNGIPRPPGSTCNNPIYLELPVVDYENTTKYSGNDYSNFMVWPYAGQLGGYDMDFVFTLEEESYVSGSISGPYWGPTLFIVDRCPELENPAPLYVEISDIHGGSFENVILPAGEYKLIVSSPKATSSYPYYTDFVLNLSASPTPDLHHVTFNTFENSTQQSPVENVEINVTGFLTNLSLTTNMFGQVNQNLYEGEYQVHVYKQDYEIQNFIFHPVSDTILDIPMNDLIWTPHSLNVETEGLYPGQALFTWIPKPSGEPWAESFEGDFPPDGWDTIVTNHGQVQEPGVDWKFTWQKYGPVNFSDVTVNPVDGDYQAFIMWSAEPQDEWLITPEFEAPAGELEFWYFGRNGAPYGDYFVKVSTDGGESWTPIWNASELPYAQNSYDYPALVDLQPYAGQMIRVAWQAVSDYGLFSTWIIDNISAGDLKIDETELLHISKTGADPEKTVESDLLSCRDDNTAPQVSPSDMISAVNESRSNLGFSIYLDDLETPVAQGIQDPEYLFVGLEEGEYMAGVRAVYSTGQSEVVTIPFNNPSGAENYTVHFQVQNSSGQMLNGVQLKIRYAGEIIKSLQTLNGLVNTSLPSGDYDYTAFKDGYKTYYGQFTITDEAVNVSVLLEPGYQLEFEVKNENNQPVEGATVSCNGIAQTTSDDGITVFELDAGNYPYAVTHFAYNRVLSSVDLQSSFTETVTMNDLTCEPPRRLVAEIDENKHAVLNWDAPAIGNNGLWMHWDQDFSNNSIGTGSATDFDVAQRFDSGDLILQDGKFLTRIWFVPNETNCSYSVRVWTGGDAGGPANLVVDQPVIDPVIGVWNEIFLLTPVPVDATEELWFGIRNNAAEGYPAGVDVGPAIDGKGNMIRLPGNNWQTLLEVNPDLNYNWSVRGLVEAMDVKFAELPTIVEKNRDSFTGKLAVTHNAPDRSLYNPRLLLGYNVYREDEMINFNTIETNSFIDVNLPTGTSTYTVTSLWSNGCESAYSGSATLTNNCQSFGFVPGWNSMSGFVIPDDPEPEILFAPVMESLVFVQNIDGFFWPEQGINTMGDFDNLTGYAVKVNSVCDLEICGNGFTGNEITLTPGWHYLPVLSTCEVNAADVFENISDGIVIVQDLIGNKVYWPDMGIYSLEKLIPGRAYKIKTSTPVTIQFPDCGSKITGQHLEQDNLISTPVGEFNCTPFTQVIAFKGGLPKELPVGAFDAEENIFGFVSPQENNKSFSMMLQGDDPTTIKKDGFYDGEQIRFAHYHPETGEMNYFETTYDPEYGNTDGKFHNNSIAIVKSVTGLSPDSKKHPGDFVLFPNPAEETINLIAPSVQTGNIIAEIFDSEGNRVLYDEFTGRTTIDVEHVSAGIYIVKITCNTWTETRKLIIR